MPWNIRLSKTSCISGQEYFFLLTTDNHIRFEGPWLKVSSELHRIIDGGGKIIIHCRCGNGRAGTVAAQILIERGMTVENAILAVRKVRPGAIENSEQEEYLRTL